nr:zinc finger, CCHC-type [Tanacetum cinerariifolium]
LKNKSISTCSSGVLPFAIYKTNVAGLCGGSDGGIVGVVGYGGEGRKRRRNGCRVMAGKKDSNSSLNVRGDANPICTLRDYSKPSHEGYMNTIELPVRNNVVPLRSDTIHMGDANPIHTLRDYSKPSHEGYMNIIELPVGNNVVPLRSKTIILWSEDPNQYLKDFLKLVDSLDLDSENKERTRLLLFQFPLLDQASNWLERLPIGTITTWEDLTTRLLAQFFPPGRTAKLCNDILMFQQHQGESLSEA